VFFWRYEDFIRDACSRLMRNLTRKEWREYLGDVPYRRTRPSGIEKGRPGSGGYVGCELAVERGN